MSWSAITPEQMVALEPVITQFVRDIGKICPDGSEGEILLASALGSLIAEGTSKADMLARIDKCYDEIWSGVHGILDGRRPD